MQREATDCSECRKRRTERAPYAVRFVVTTLSCPIPKPVLGDFALLFVCGQHVRQFRSGNHAIVELPVNDYPGDAPHTRIGRRIVTLVTFADVTISEVARALDLRIEQVRVEADRLKREGYLTDPAVVGGLLVLRASREWHPDNDVPGREGGPHTPLRRFRDDLDEQSQWYGVPDYADRPPESVR